MSTSAFSPLDAQRMHEALDLAELSIGVSDPNPRVGCVIGRSDGTVLAMGSTKQAGQAHAEAVALQSAAECGVDLRGATAWVTLEPCSHHGRTPPCCDALIQAGISRVVIATEDPFPMVNGVGIQRLRAAGVDVVMANGDLAGRAQALNIGFFSRVIRKRPWVRLKVAMSLDGHTALNNGRSQWITQEAARTDGHLWRRRAGAVLTGVGTVLEDDPHLGVRLVPTTLQPRRVVVDSKLRTPTTARVLQPPSGTLIYTLENEGPQWDRLEAAGAVLRHSPTAGGRVDLVFVLEDLASREINELHVEAGSELNGALLNSDLVDELLVYMAPMLTGPGRSLASLPALEQLGAAKRLSLISSLPVGDDLRMLFRPMGRAHALT